MWHAAACAAADMRRCCLVMRTGRRRGGARAAVGEAWRWSGGGGGSGGQGKRVRLERALVQRWAGLQHRQDAGTGEEHRPVLPLSRAEAREKVRAGEVRVAGVVHRDPAVLLKRWETVEMAVRGVGELPVHAALLVVHQAAQEQQKQERRMRSGYHPVGRLDAWTTGLWLFSANGTLTERLLADRSALTEQEFEIVIAQKGVPLDEARMRVKDVLQLWERQRPPPSPSTLTSPPSTPPPTPSFLEKRTVQVLSAAAATRDTSTDVDTDGTRLTIVLRRHVQCRRLLRTCGYDVLSMHRTRIGAVSLGDLLPGESTPFIPATQREQNWLNRVMAVARNHEKQKRRLRLRKQQTERQLAHMSATET